MKAYSFIAYAMFVFVVSCSHNIDSNELNNQEQTNVVEDNEWDSLIRKIDQELPELTRIESLVYYKEDASSMEAIAYLDQNNLITKITQEYLDGHTGYKTTLQFYSNGGVRFASRKTSVKGEANNAFFSEEITLYDPKGSIILSKERRSEYEANIESEYFYLVDTIRHDDSEAFLILRQQDAYSTTFQGFVENGPFHFLVVGEHTEKDGYTASLSIQEDTPTLRYLREKGKLALGTELEIEFERYVDPTGYMMQILRKVALVERK